MMVQAPNGDVLVSEVGANRITLFRGNSNNARPETRFEFVLAVERVLKGPLLFDQAQLLFS